VVEDERGGQAQAGGRGQPVAQFDRGQRVEPEVLERPSGFQRAGRGVSEHRGGLALDQGEQFPLLLVRGEPGQPPGQAVRGLRARVVRGLARGADQGAEHGRQPACARLGTQRTGVQAGRDRRRVL
jgi:hypothetical protein